MKYKLGMQTVEAVYDNNGTQNPLIEALPDCLGRNSSKSISGAVRRRPRRART